MEKKMNFEQAIARLEEITKLLEKGDVPLEKSLEYFEEGTILVKKCRSLLEQAEQKVKILSKAQDGSYKLSDFEVEDA